MMNASKPVAVLVVDDDLDAGRNLQLALSKSGIEALAVTNRIDALAEVICGYPTVVVVDRDLGEESGTKLLEEMATVHPNTIRILISGAARRGDAGLQERGVFGAFLQKPVSANELLAVVQKQASNP